MNGNKIAESIRKIVNNTTKRNGFDSFLDKVNITSAGNGQCLGEMVVEKVHTNFYDTLHGGCIASIIDGISSMAVLTHPRIVSQINSAPYAGVSIDIHLSYLAAAKIGDKIVINAETIKLGKNLAFLEILLTRKDDNTILAKATHTKFMRR